jgi:uncharacterized membrane protein YhaH (DUF805 family)
MTAPYDPYEGQPSTRTPGEDVPRQETPRQETPRHDQDDQRDSYPPRASYTPYPQGTGLGYAGGTGYPGTERRSYLNGGPARFGAAVSQGLAHLLTFRGRASRSAFWWFILFTIIVQTVLETIVSTASHGVRSADEALSVVATLLTLTLTIRRLHDSNRTGWWWLIGWVPVIGWLVLLVFALLPGTRGPNRFDVSR